MAAEQPFKYSREGYRPSHPMAMPRTAYAGLEYCEGCDALSSFKEGKCQMCELRGGPIERRE